MDSVVCIGAGPAGLTAAYELVKHKQPVLVLEADPTYVGGIARTIREKGANGEFFFDIGGHRFFSKSQEVVGLWKEILGDQLQTRPRKSRIFYAGKFYPYPLDLIRTLRNLGMVESVVCGLSYFKARVMPRANPKSFEEWVSNEFGVRLFQIFFKTYTEKVWGMSCKEISVDWAAQRIKGLSLPTVVKNAALRMFGMQGTGGGVKTLIEEFLYPKQGPGMMWEVAAQKIEAQGGEIRLGQRVEKLTYNKAKRQWQINVRDDASGRLSSVYAEQVISSMPLRELVYAVEGAPEAARAAAAQLRYRDFIIVALVLKDKKTFDDNWIYIHSPEVRVGRIQNFKAWSPDMVSNPDLVCYGMEYFCFEDDGLWTSSSEELIALASDELIRIGLAAREDILSGYVVRQNKAYPVYDQVYESYVDIIRQWLETCPNLQVVGRNGMHKYNNQDHSMMTAMLAVKNIVAGQCKYNVWNVNQDAEYHEESESGASGERLVPVAAAELESA